MWNYDLIVDGDGSPNVSLQIAELMGIDTRRIHVTQQQFDKIVSQFESFRYSVENTLDGFDEDCMSWRDFAVYSFDYLPDELCDGVLTYIQQLKDGVCPLCQRPLGTVNVEAHHLMPKMYGGKELVDIHKMCHQKTHSTFAESELKRYYHTVDRLLEHEEMQKFVKWIAKKEPEFYDKNDDTSARKSKRNN
jgi:hypothetical protein